MSRHRRRSRDSPQPAAESASYGLYKLVFGFGIVATAVWFYAIFEWWGAFAAALLCLPAGFGFTVVTPALLGTLRRLARGNDVAWACVLLIGGLAVALFGALMLAGPVRAIAVLLAAALVLAGITVIQLRPRR